MSEVIKSSIRVATLGNAASAAGLGSLSDQHGNSTRGFTLSCAGKPDVTLSLDDWTELHSALAPHSMLSFSFDGDIPLRGGAANPLKAACDAKPENSRQKTPRSR